LVFIQPDGWGSSYAALPQQERWWKQSNECRLSGVRMNDVRRNSVTSVSAVHALPEHFRIPVEENRSYVRNLMSTKILHVKTAIVAALTLTAGDNGHIVIKVERPLASRTIALTGSLQRKVSQSESSLQLRRESQQGPAESPKLTRNVNSDARLQASRR